MTCKTQVPSPQGTRHVAEPRDGLSRPRAFGSRDMPGPSPKAPLPLPSEPQERAAGKGTRELGDGTELAEEAPSRPFPGKSSQGCEAGARNLTAGVSKETDSPVCRKEHSLQHLGLSPVRPTDF